MDATASLPGGLAEEPRKIDSLIQVGVTWLCSKTAWERPTHSYFMKIKKWLWNCVSPWILTEKNNTFPTLYVTVYVTSQNQPGKRGEKKKRHWKRGTVRDNDLFLHSACERTDRCLTAVSGRQRRLCGGHGIPNRSGQSPN